MRLEAIFDQERDCYQLMAIGWLEKQRLHKCVMHVDRKDGLVWLEANNSDYGLAEQHERLGVRKEEIVFAFNQPKATSK